MTPLPRLGMILLSAGVLLVGCNKDDTAIRTYDAPKDIPAPAVASSDPHAPDASGDEASSTVQVPPANWTVPADWKQVPVQNAMETARFSISSKNPNSDLTVVRLGPEAAEVLPNVVRWAGQLKLPKPAQADLPKYVRPTQVSGEQGELVEMTGSPESGKPPTALLAAIVPHESSTWFFTLKASEPVVQAQKANFEKFVHSVQFPAGSPPPDAQTSDADSSPDDSSDAAHWMDPATENESFKLVKWQTPAGWQEEPGSNSMRVTSFRIGTGEDQAEVIVSRIARGQMGSFTANINRWRDQVGLDPVQTMSTGMFQPAEEAGHHALSLSFTGPKNASGTSKQVVVVMSIEGRDFWFVKMLGSESVVSKQQDALKRFLKSMQFEPEAQK